MVRVGIVGTTGYTGRETLRLLSNHPGVEVVAVASESAAGKPLGDVLPAFRKVFDLTCEAFDAAALAKRCDLVILCVPSTKAMAFGAELRQAGVRVLDVAPDFRLKDADLYERTYVVAHCAPERLAEAVYGLVPFYREQLGNASLVAVPGCYPISAILPLRPLRTETLTDVPIVIDSISGISGAGRSLSDHYHFPEMNENLRAYSLGVHRHVPEIEQELFNKVKVQFTPHVAPLTRGILTTITIHLRRDANVDLDAAYEPYRNEPFVRILPPGTLPEVKYVKATNFCDIGWYHDSRTGNLIIVSAIDNLMGGTAGMAVQCLNIMFGLDERAGIASGGMAP